MAFLRPGSALSSKAWRPGHHVLDIVSSPAHPLQIYRTATRDPYLNLSIEHYLLQNSHPESTVLFLYRNSPSVVIGRNQNPWLEVNLSRLRAGLPTTAEPVRLVRRRSGGGAVFHDDGNVNWSVICPPPSFDRDKHAEMVVRALRRLGVQDVRVNCRHDIVMGGGRKNKEGERKISGSAYKLTRLRSLHHGTCLLSSPHLAQISGLLRSPAEPYIKARGVESVRSKIANVERGPEEFCTAIQDEFQAMYKRETAVQAITDSQCEWPADLQKGYEELKVGWRSRSQAQMCTCRLTVYFAVSRVDIWSDSSIHLLNPFLRGRSKNST